jgi:hypothetical protein
MEAKSIAVVRSPSLLEKLPVAPPQQTIQFIFGIWLIVGCLRQRAEDVPYEEDVLQNSYTLKSWWRYLEAKLAAPPAERFVLFERALGRLPGSYKLWKAYLDEKRGAVRGKFPLDDPAYEALNNTFERALVYMHKVACSLPTMAHLRVERFYIGDQKSFFAHTALQ